jgi:nucleoside-diphosphate-sugar epimerase
MTCAATKPASRSNPAMSGNHVLVTGLSGFTGRHLGHALKAAGFDITGTGREADETGPFGPVEVAPLDDLARLETLIARVQPDYVIHLAGQAFVAHGDVSDIYQSNVVGTRNLLAALAGTAKTPRKVILASSANIYGSTDIGFVGEDTPPKPANDYAVSKLAMEYAARMWMDKLPIVITRPFNYTGVGQDPKFLIPKIVSHFRDAAQMIELGNTFVIRDFSDVRTVSEIYVRLLRSDAAGEAFNICSGTGHSLIEMIEMMQQIAGYKIDVQVNPAFVREGEIHKLIGDKRKLESTIGPLPLYDMHATLEWMYHA